MGSKGCDILKGGIDVLNKIFKKTNMTHLILMTMIIYVTVHLIEEGIFGFPAWALNRWGIPNYTTLKWLIHNIYFITFLGIGFFIYRRNKEKYLAVGFGIILWGLMNTLNHVIFSLIYLEYSPGLFTGLLFLVVAHLAFYKLKEHEKFSLRHLLLSCVLGVIYWAVPIIAFISVDQMIGL